MSEVSREEKIRTIKLASQVMANMLEEYFPKTEMDEYRANVAKLTGRPTPQAETETVDDREKLLEVLAAAKAQRGEAQ